MGALFGLVFGVGFGGIAYLFARERKKRIEEAWRQAATELGLMFTPGSGHLEYPQIRGEARGVSIHLDVNLRASGNNQQHPHTRCRLVFPTVVDDTFHMSKQQPFSVFARLLGRRDLNIGDPSFDSRVVIDGDDPVALDRYLTPARRMAILRLMEGRGNVDVTARSISIETPVVDEDSYALKARIRQLVDVALILGAPSDVDHALEKQQRGDLADAVDALHDLNDVQDAPANSFTQRLEAEALVAMGEGAKARKVFDELPVFDAELDEWRNVAKRHPEPVALKPIAPTNLSPADQPAIEIPPDAEVELGQQAIIADLFDSDRLGYEVEQRFFDVYEGEVVEWVGVVRRKREFRSDQDFPGAGVKATVEIGSQGDSKLVSKKVHAVVHLPEGTSLELDQRIRFRGTFVRTDRYMRNLFVANAQLL